MQQAYKVDMNFTTSSPLPVSTYVVSAGLCTNQLQFSSSTYPKKSSDRKYN